MGVDLSVGTVLCRRMGTAFVLERVVLFPVFSRSFKVLFPLVLNSKLLGCSSLRGREEGKYWRFFFYTSGFFFNSVVS